MDTLTHTEVLSLLRQHIKDRYGSQSEAARQWGVSREYVSQVLREHRPPPDWILREIGFQRERLTVYRKCGEIAA